MATVGSLLPLPPVLANVFVNVLLLGVGAFIGSIAIYFGRRFIRRYEWDGYPKLLVGVDAFLVIVATALASATDIWKKPTWTEISAHTGSAIFLMGSIIAAGIGSKILLSIAREAKDARTADLKNEVTTLSKQRDIALTTEALLCEVMTTKMKRLVAWRTTGHGTLTDAIDPKHHIHVLIQVLHKYLIRYVQAQFKLRIGIYMLAEDQKTLEVVYGWNGEQTGCYSNSHSKYMRIASPGGSRSLIVECWIGAEPFHCVADTAAAVRAGKFKYFDQDQERGLRSMVAYRHNLTGDLGDDAFILTLDSNQPGLFSADVEAECRLLLPSFAKRIELEQLSLPTNHSH